MIDERIAALLQEVGIQTSGIEATIEGCDPIMSTPFHIGEAAATALGACGVAAAALWQERTGQGQSVYVNTARAAASLLSPLLLQLDGRPLIQIDSERVSPFFINMMLQLVFPDLAK